MNTRKHQLGQREFAIIESLVDAEIKRLRTSAPFQDNTRLISLEHLAERLLSAHNLFIEIKKEAKK